MNKSDIRKLVRLGVKALGGIGAAKIVYNVSPYEGVFGSLACGTFAFFATMAAMDMIDDQLLQCEKILAQMSNNDTMVIF